MNKYEESYKIIEEFEGIISMQKILKLSCNMKNWNKIKKILEKEKPMKVNKTWLEFYICPNCYETWFYNDTDYWEYCPYCGKKIEI